MTYVSCAPGNIYRNGSWYDDPVLLNEFSNGPSALRSPEIVAEIFPPYEYHRDLPVLIGGSDAERGRVFEVARSTLASVSKGPGSVLARVENGCVSRSVVYMLDPDGARVVYETHRPNDRLAAVLRHKDEIRMVDEFKRADPFVAYLWIGSPGSKNYGHWLVDDLPRLRALQDLRRVRPYARIVIVAVDCGEVHNAVHTQSAGAVAMSLGIDNVEMITVSWEARIFFEELYFVTPVTNHPVMKSPDAMRFVAEHVVSGLDETVLPPALRHRPKRLFVGRAWTGLRDLANQAEIAEMLAADGFVAVDAGTMPVLAQAMLFAGADTVVGCMGASMTNTLFCPDGSRIGHIAPEGWIETFFWDLAATRNHDYVATYGNATPQDSPAWHKNYRVNPADVRSMLDQLQVSPPAPHDPFFPPPPPARPAPRRKARVDPFSF